jgi:nitrite reductase (NO-forming)
VTSYQSTQPYRHVRGKEPGSSGVGVMILALFLGIAVGILAITVVALVKTADDARDDAAAAATTTDHSSHTSAASSESGAVSLPLQSFAGQTGENAEELAMAHAATDATLPPVPAGDLVKVNMTLKDMVVEIAPGVKYNTWAFDGHGAPGPVVHVREGQMVEMTLTNGGAIPHSIDFHAARIAPNLAFRDAQPGESFTFRFRANDPGVFMYHCGTKPVLAHIANGMYGAIIVEPREGLPAVDNEYVLVGSEWYLNGDGVSEPASLDMTKARTRMADWVTFNGYANQYVTHPLTADPGETTRFWVVAAGPTNNVNFHIVGTIFDRAWVNSDMTSPPQRGVQTVVVPAGGGAAFDVKIDEEGSYPFVSHAFADVDLGQVGLLKVGNPKTTMSH